ncbi:MAG: hypothetical protein ACUVTL_08540 [Thermoproteota archaeon]
MIVSASGIRGVFEPREAREFFTRFGYVVGKQLGGKIALGRDSRPSGQAICSAILEGLSKTKASTTYVGLCTVPVMAHAVRKRYISTTMMVTASHNPPEWNGLKIFTGDGLILDGDKLSSFVEMSRSNIWPSTGRACIRYKEDKKLLELYVQDSLSLASLLGANDCSLKVVIDAGNGPSSLTVPRILEGLGCKTEILNKELNGHFNRPIEPLPENLLDLRKEVIESHADLGAGFDCDGDRVVLVSEDGEVLREDYTLALAVDYYLSLRKGPVVVNRATSMLLDQVCINHSVPLIRAGVGERNVASRMLESGAEIGGEGSSGGVILQEFELARDGALALILVSGFLKKEKRSLSSILKRYPRYYLRRENIRFPSEKFKEILSDLKNLARSMGEVDILDDIRVSGNGWWVLVRPSATEPVLRILSEAESEEEAESRMKIFTDKIRERL